MSFQIGGVSSTGKILSWGGRSVAINKINAVDVVCDKRAFPKIALLGVFLGLIFLGKDPFLGLLLLGILASGFTGGLITFTTITVSV